ncbi:MAG: putative minor capsid protein 10B [Prokaryotic dsDNA virus sp.]|nr:MAG: putative minor capsid protein 10B [Prokaryotic dsDNA virus sp.]|tara:strand:+ start:5252 stop:6157 length:906 start_codon:yes stop_codon:yes gene_type:complete
MSKHYQGSAVTNTTDQHFIPEIWADGIYKYFERKSVFRGLVDDYSALFAGKGYGDVLHIPEMSLISASDKDAGADVSYDATATTETQLTVNKHKYVAKLFEDLTMIQSEADLVEKYARMMGEALSRQVDADIWTELQSLEDSLLLADDDTLTAGKFEEALATLGEADIPYMDGECAMVVNPTLFADILNPSAGIAQYFIRNDAVGEGNRGLRTGLVGSLYGIDVYMSNTVDTANEGGAGTNTISGAIFHKSAVAFASQQDVRVQSEYSIDALGTKVVADLLYGVKRIDDTDNKKGLKIRNA